MLRSSLDLEFSLGVWLRMLAARLEIEVKHAPHSSIAVILPNLRDYSLRDNTTYRPRSPGGEKFPGDNYSRFRSVTTFAFMLYFLTTFVYFFLAVPLHSSYYSNFLLR